MKKIGGEIIPIIGLAILVGCFAWRALLGG